MTLYYTHSHPHTTHTHPVLLSEAAVLVGMHPLTVGGKHGERDGMTHNRTFHGGGVLSILVCDGFTGSIINYQNDCINALRSKTVLI